MAVRPLPTTKIRGVVVTDLAPYQAAAPAIVRISADDLAVIRRQIVPPRGVQPPTDVELSDFARVAMARRLDPFDRQIYIANFGQGWRPYIGVHGRLVLAMRTGEVDGMEGPYFAAARTDAQKANGDPVDWQEYWSEQAPPHVAKFVVYRRGWTKKVPVGAAPWRYYGAGKDFGLWKTNPPLALGYKAIVRALNLVFPDVMPPEPDRDVDVDESTAYTRDDPPAPAAAPVAEAAYVIHRPAEDNAEAHAARDAKERSGALGRRLNELWRDCELGGKEDAPTRAATVSTALGREVDQRDTLSDDDLEVVIGYVEQRKAEGWKGF